MAMRILHVVQGLGIESGGVDVSVRQLAASEARFGNELSILTSTDTADSSNRYSDEIEPAVNGVREEPRPLCWWTGKFPTLLETVKRAEIVHISGVWEGLPHAVLRAAFKRGVPVVVAPRGMLEPWAVKHHRWRKRLAMALYQRRDLSRAACLHALSETEQSNFRDLGLTNPTAIIPNGIGLSPFAEMPARGRMERLFPELGGRKLILFLGRIHPKKGLPHTVRAWATLAGQFAEWDLVVAGWDQGGHRSQVERLVLSLGIIGRVHFVGKVEGERKYALLGNAEVFILSSFSEGFSMAVLEAMAAGLPVLMTRECNFPEAAQVGAAILANPDKHSTAASIEKLLRMSDGDRQNMGERGRKLVLERYTWDRVAAKMIETYQYILGERPRPPWVREADH